MNAGIGADMHRTSTYLDFGCGCVCGSLGMVITRYCRRILSCEQEFGTRSELCRVGFGFGVIELGDWDCVKSGGCCWS